MCTLSWLATEHDGTEVTKCVLSGLTMGSSEDSSGVSHELHTLMLHLFNISSWQGDRGEARGYVARLLQMGVAVGTATAAGFLLGRTALPSLFTADSQVAPVCDCSFKLLNMFFSGVMEHVRIYIRRLI